MMVDEATGGLEVCHRLILSSKDFAGHPGPVGKFLLPIFTGMNIFF